MSGGIWGSCFSSTTFLLAGGRSLSGTKLINAFLTVSLLAPCVVCAVLPSFCGFPPRS
ncbi:hypothetical protein BDV98DRAFT_573354 [Pterulicium gracile]|uniref:Uncharacterized protein n=1 Tax=Pterulicium gracile TaxID=1884261 RepID=A0A5C3Q8X1_9AGAR|nr:hypothetical protein BDV98DRAFT_573354 [Pterula gracilis]